MEWDAEMKLCEICGIRYAPIVNERYCSALCKYELEEMEKMIERLPVGWPTYLQLLKDYQQLELEVKELKKVIEITNSFINLLNGTYGGLLCDTEGIVKLKNNFQEISNQLMKRQIQCADLKFYLNAGNLRYIVSTLFTDEGLTAKEFAEKIGYSEEDIIALIQDGRVTYNLLDTICRYFNILLTSDMQRYIH